MGPMALRLAAVFLWLMMWASASGCGDDTPSPPVFTPTFQQTDCAFEAQGARCGYVEVPERHSRPAGARIRLSVVLLPSKAAQPAPDPLLMLTGGAGASAIDSFLELMLGASGEAIRARREIVLFDQRGTGASTPALKCPELEAMVAANLGEPRDEAQQRSLTTQALQACHDRLVAEGVDLSAYHSVESASDVAAVMKALGFESYNIYALSYGTILTQHVLRDHSEGVRSVMLDSIAPVERNILASAPANADRALRLLFASCAADSACAAAYPDLEETTWEVMQALDAAPVAIKTSHPTTGDAVTWPLTGNELLGKLLNTFNAATIPYLPYFINGMAAGDFSILDETRPNWATTDSTFADAREYTFRCTEAMGFSLEELPLQALYPRVATFFTTVLSDIQDVCAAWGLEPVVASALEPVKRDTPALLMVGRFDITTPPELAEQARQNLRNSFLFEFEATGHVVLGDCALSLMAAFLEEPATRPDGACVDQLGLSFFVLP